MSASAALGEVRQVDLPAGTIRYRERGRGQPIVFLHGIVANGDLWRRVSPRLVHAYRCIVPDWPLGSHELGLHEGVDLSLDRKSTRLNSSHVEISYAVFC